MPSESKFQETRVRQFALYASIQDKCLTPNTWEHWCRFNVSIHNIPPNTKNNSLIFNFRKWLSKMEEMVVKWKGGLSLQWFHEFSFQMSYFK